MRRLLTLIASYFLIMASASHGQVVPDDSLPNNSVVSDELEVTGGTRAGNNLFHSFDEFSINTGETVFFDHVLAIENIISRVTGENISRIDGLIRGNGTADLFLINPNGIIFGENAALDIGGSFIGTTAESIQFADGSEFSAANRDTTPLLTVSIPVGLQYGANPGDITLEGTANNLTIDAETFTVDRTNLTVGLEVNNGETLALVGGNVFLPGGNLTVAEGRVVIGSVDRNNFVELIPDTLGWIFNYAEVSNFQNISLSQAASIEVSGNGGGEVRLQGRVIEIADGSAILADTLGNSSGRVLELSATESIELTGFAPNESFPTRLSTDVDLGAVGDGGGLLLNTDSLVIADGAQVTSSTFGLGNAGNLQVSASNIEVIGESASGEFFSGLFSQADIEDTGNGGDLSITTDSLLVDRGAQISTTTFGSGNAGNLNIAANSIELRGFSDNFGNVSGLFVSTEADGNGGDLSIQTNTLLVTDGAEISTTTFGSGNSGNLSIAASTINLGGGLSGNNEVSGLFANADIESSGNSGNLIIDTDSLSINDGAQILAITNSVGNAGTIAINSKQLNLNGTSADGLSPSAIAVDVFFSEGTGGNIEIATESLEIGDGAQIGSITSGTGNGGDLNIVASDFIRLRGTSESGSSGLFANAVVNDGAGGNLTVETDSLFVLDGATISVSNFPSSDDSVFTPGQGAAGNLTIIADEIELADSSTISADTFTGDRGNIDFATDLLLLRRGSLVSTNAQGNSTGGNITIEASDGFVVAFPEENSDITANAVFGDGGRVNIEALNILGIEFRPNLTPFSDITTSSEFGIAGNVTLRTQDLNPVEDLDTLPNSLNPPQLAQGCEAGTENRSNFVNIGQGGLSPQPQTALGAEDFIGDVQLPREWLESNVGVREAQDWIRNDQGKIELVAKATDQPSLYNCQLN